MKNELIDIKKLRENQGLTQDEFAEILDVSRSTVAKIEANKLKISKKMLLKLRLNFREYFKGLEYDRETLNSTHLITHRSTLLINENITKEYVLSEVEQKLPKLKNYSEGLVDLKMMFLENKSKDIAVELFEFMDDFEDIRIKYFTDFNYSLQGINPYKINNPININNLNTAELLLYLKSLNENVVLFEDVFFEYFKRFFRHYMKYNVLDYDF